MKQERLEGERGVKGEGSGRTCQSDRCYWKLPEPGSSEVADQTWQGSFTPSKDQHLWHLEETCLETGEKCQRGIMAIYVDDVLMTAEEPVAEAAMIAISKVWECSPGTGHAGKTHHVLWV